MPTVTVDGPHIADIEKRRALVRGLTDVAENAFGIDKAHIVVLIREHKPENVAVGGELIIDRQR
jgi:4-oxalocrotonate tautomerase family enzyme